LILEKLGAFNLWETVIDAPFAERELPATGRSGDESMTTTS
jgi:hypothetical protein